MIVIELNMLNVNLKFSCFHGTWRALSFHSLLLQYLVIINYGLLSSLAERYLHLLVGRSTTRNAYSERRRSAFKCYLYLCIYIAFITEVGAGHHGHGRACCIGPTYIHKCLSFSLTPVAITSNIYPFDRNYSSQQTRDLDSNRAAYVFTLS